MKLDEARRDEAGDRARSEDRQAKDQFIRPICEIYWFGNDLYRRDWKNSREIWDVLNPSKGKTMEKIRIWIWTI